MTEPFTLVDEGYFLINHWRQINPQIVAGFSTKNGGFSNKPYDSNNFGFHVADEEEKVVQNREQLANKIQLPLESWVCCEQTHGKNVQYTGKDDWGRGARRYDSSLKDTDGVFSDDKDTFLALMFADCVPVYFYSPKDQLIGIAHAGWKGTVENINHSLIYQWYQRGVSPQNILVAIGPSICEDCYIVDKKVIQKVEQLNIKNTFYRQIEKNQYKLDLKGLNKALILDAGIPEENILITNYCTSCHSSYFYSHRRDQGKTGRMMGFIGMREDIKN